jgi:hypothetical protein
MCGVEWIHCDGFQDEIEFITANYVRFRARPFVSRGPVFLTILFDFREELVGPQVLHLYLNVFCDFIQIVYLALHPDGGNGGF